MRLYLLWVSPLFTTSPNGVPYTKAGKPASMPCELSFPREDYSSSCKDSHPCGSVLRLSQPLDGFLRHLAFGLVSSQAMSRVRPVQGLLSPCSCSPSSRKLFPLAVAGTMTHRPRPIPPSSRLNFEALVHTKQRCRSLGLTAPQLAPLVRLSSPPGALPLTLRSSYPEPSARDVAGQDLRSHDNLSRSPPASSQ